MEAVALREQRLDLGGGERLAVEGDADLEVEQRVLAELCGRSGADGGAHHRARRAARAPGAGHADDHAGGLERRQIVQHLHRVGGRPAQRMEDLAALDHGGEPRRRLRRALHGEQQRQQRVLARGARVLLQRLAERQVLRLGRAGEPRGVGGEEREGRLLVAAVLGEVEVDAADQVPGRALRVEEVLERLARGGVGRAQRVAELGPQRGERVGGDVLAASHRRRGARQLGQLGERRRDRRRRLGAGADRRDVARGEVAPEAERRRQRRADLGRAEPEEAGAGAVGEGGDQARGDVGRQGRGVVVVGQCEPAVRRQLWREGAHGR
jgi:hypothetical protein